ncbi:MAG: hypothetical protein K0Q77_78 [Anaerosporomusa subterranea]|nr:hypothetical protein [Anaerosporomusa subterranea]
MEQCIMGEKCDCSFNRNGCVSAPQLLDLGLGCIAVCGKYRQGMRGK